MVGPIVEAQLLTTEEMPECEAGCDIDGLADMTDFVRQWAQVCTLLPPTLNPGFYIKTLFSIPYACV